MATLRHLSVCQKSQVSPQTTALGLGKTLSEMMASGLVASCFVLMLGTTNSVHLPVTKYTCASGYNSFCSSLTVIFAARTAKPA